MRKTEDVVKPEASSAVAARIGLYRLSNTVSWITGASLPPSILKALYAYADNDCCEEGRGVRVEMD